VSNYDEARDRLIGIMIEQGHFIPHGDLLEDMGGHYLHRSDNFMLDHYIKDWLECLPSDERKEVMAEVKDNVN